MAETDVTAANVTTVFAYSFSDGLHQPVGDPETVTTADIAVDTGQQPLRGASTADNADDFGQPTDREVITEPST